MQYIIHLCRGECALETRSGDEDLVRVEFVLTTTTHRNEPSPFTRQIFLNNFKQLVTDEKVEWISPGYHKSVFDLDLMKKTFEKLGALDWLNGKVSVEPEYEDKILNAEFIYTIERFQSHNPDAARRSPMPVHREARLFFTLLPELSQTHCRFSDAPVEIHNSLERFRADHPDPSKAAFLIMRFSETRIHLEIYETIAKCLRRYGIAALRADVKHYHDDLYYNILTFMHGCGFGVAVFERIEEELFNPNISLEVGYLLAMQKPICILKDRTLKTLHTDLMGKLYKVFDPMSVGVSLDAALSNWLSGKSLI